MSLPHLRPAARALSRIPPALSRAPAARRWASEDSHSDAHEPSHEPTNETYPAESFFTPFWRNVLLLSVGGYGVSYFWPSSTGDRPWLTRFIDGQTRDNTATVDSQLNHVAFAKAAADDRLDTQSAQRPKVHRYRYKGMFDQADPNLIPVGSQADLSDLHIKTYADFYKDEPKK